MYDSSFFSVSNVLSCQMADNKDKETPEESVKINCLFPYGLCRREKIRINWGKSIRMTASDSNLFELPITTVTLAGLPLIGTSAIVFPEFIYHAMLKFSLKEGLY